MITSARRAATLLEPPDLTSDACLAFHEAGHAVVGLSLGIPIRYATLVPSYSIRGRAAAGHVATDVPYSRIRPERLVLFLLAGPAAERGYSPLSRVFDETFAQCDDFEDARLMVSLLHGTLSSSARVTRALPAWHRRADHLVDREWAGIVRVATALQQWRHLSGVEITRAWRETP